MIKEIKEGVTEVPREIILGVKEGCVCIVDDTTRPTREVITEVCGGIKEGYYELLEMVSKPLNILNTKMMGSYSEIEALESRQK